MANKQTCVTPMSNETIRSHSSSYEETTNQLNSFLKNPCKLKEGALEELEQIYKEALLQSDSRFYARVEKTILVTKKRILDLLAVSFKTIDKQTLQQLAPKLLILTKSFKELLKQSIINFAIQLDELSCKTHNINTKDLIGKLQTIFGPLLRHFFVYKEYLRIKQQEIVNGSFGDSPTESGKSQRDILTNLIAKQQKCRVDSPIKISYEREIQQIEQRFEEATIRQLMHQYLQKQYQGISDIEQICRICSQKIKVEQLKVHVAYCNKTSQLRQRQIRISADLRQIVDELKLKQIQIQFSDQPKTESEIKFAELLKLIFKSAPRGPGARRSSIFSSAKNLTNQVQQKINNYLLNDQNKVLEDFLHLHQEKQEIEEKILTLQKNYQNQKDKALTNQNSLKSFGELKKLCDNKSNVKSKFAKRSSSQTSNMSMKAHDLIKQSQNKASNSIISSIQSLQSIKEDNKEAFTIQKGHLSEKKIEDLRGSRLSKNSRIDKQLRASRKSRDKTNTKKRSNFIPGNMQISNASRMRLRRNPTMVQGDSDSSQHEEMGTRKCLSGEVQMNRSFKQKSEMSSSSISIKNFQILLFLGKGAFGRVYLARRLRTKDVYAIKVINIKPNWGQQQLQAIKNEHQIFKKIGGDHLVKAPFSFRQGMAHFFIMQFMPGGDLGKLLAEEVYLQENIAKFYIVEIILAIEHLHKAGIIHRDLKPQNLCIDHQGHLKLTDFGLSEIRIQDKITHAKEVLGKTKLSYELPKRTHTFKKRTAIRINRKSEIKLIGTPDYIAPQIINKTSINNQTIDWWSLGVMIYEILIGVRPFCGETIEEIIDNILQFNIEWPQVGNQEGMITIQAKDLIQKLIDRDFTKRLGVNGAQQILNHPFFKGVSWQDIKSLKPPFPPKKSINMQDLEDLQQDSLLRRQIDDAMNLHLQNKGQTDNLDNDDLRVTNFVRYDLLGAETIEIAQKNIVNKGSKLKRLASLAKNMNFDSEKEVGRKIGTIKSLPKKQLHFSIFYEQQMENKENLSLNQSSASLTD